MDVLQGCYSDVKEVSQGCYMGITHLHVLIVLITVNEEGIRKRALAAIKYLCYKGVTRVLQGCCKGVARVLQGCYKSVIVNIH
jgi:hypothetical protein